MQLAFGKAILKLSENQHIVEIQGPHKDSFASERQRPEVRLVLHKMEDHECSNAKTTTESEKGSFPD